MNLASLALVGIISSFTWIITAVLSRMYPSIFLPQAVRYLLGAFVLFLIPLFRYGKFPRVSLRLFHAAITVAILAYVLSPLLCYYGLKVLPSTTAALIYLSLPMWFIPIAYKKFEKFPFAGLSLLGIFLFFAGVFDEASLRGIPWLPFLSLWAGLFSFLLGVWVSRRLFWLHTSLDLNFYAMLFAVAIHLVLAFVSGEVAQTPNWSKPFWGLLIILGAVITGVGTYFLRPQATQWSSVIYNGAIPWIIFTIGFLCWQETPLNIWTLSGLVIFTVSLLMTVYNVPAKKWMGLYLQNDKRQGDRLNCHFSGFIQTPDNQKVEVVVTELSLNGLGLTSKMSLEPGQEILLLLQIPPGQNEVRLQSKIVHGKKVEGRDMVWVGGAEFIRLSADKKQSIVEFLARLTQAQN